VKPKSTLAGDEAIPSPCSDLPRLLKLAQNTLSKCEGIGALNAHIRPANQQPTRQGSTFWCALLSVTDLAVTRCTDHEEIPGDGDQLLD